MTSECAANNIPVGYKLTEVGVIPEDWEIHTIQELIDDNSIVGHLDGNHGELYPRSHEFKLFGIPYITANDLSGSKVSFKNCKYLSEERASKFKKGVSKNGDVLFAHNATVGPTALLSTLLDYVILSTTATYFRCNPDKLVNLFLLYLLQSPFFINQYQGVMAQSTRNQVPITAQRKLKLVIPLTLAEQEAIAQALADVDALIESLEQLIAKKRQIKQGAMQELLTGKRRMPGFKIKEGYKQTEIGLLPEDWSTITLEQATLIDGLVRGPFGGALKKESFVDSGYKVYEQRNAIYETIEIGNYFIDSSKYNELKRFSVNPKDMIVSCSGTIGCIYQIPSGAPEGVINQALLKISLNKDIINFNFFLAIFKSKSFQERIKENSHGGAMQNLVGMDVFRKTLLELPPKAEQDAIATILSNMEAEIDTLEVKLTKTRKLKQGMMQELLTGRIRLV